MTHDEETAPKGDTPFTQMDALIRSYAATFEIDDGADVSYAPNDFERYMIEAAINGLICDELFCELLLAGRAITHQTRIDERSCIRCGAPDGYEHYPACVTRQKVVISAGKQGEGGGK